MGRLPGPHLVPVTDVSGWWSKKCDEAGLARMLRDTGEPVVVLNGRAELGPRALGNRSILAAATSSKMKDLLNDMKCRESYGWWLRFSWKAVCLKSRVPEIFSPGSSDPYMLFDHTVRAGWVDRIPAVIHLDGTARLQTINARQNSVVEWSARGIRKIEQNSSFVQYQRQSQRPRIFFGRVFGGAVETR
jgi:carbamoyltransferase